MKVFQIVSEFCYWDATPQFPSIEATIGCFQPDFLFVEAPDFVHEGWGFDGTQEGDARFVRPEAPEGFEFDAPTGTFYRAGRVAPSKEFTLLEALGDKMAEIEYRLDIYSLGMTEGGEV